MKKMIKSAIQNTRQHKAPNQNNNDNKRIIIKDSFVDLWDNIKQNISIIGIPEGKERE